MGFTPAEVGAMSLWEFKAAVSGFEKSNGPPEGPKFPTMEEHVENVKRVTLH